MRISRKYNLSHYFKLKNYFKFNLKNPLLTKYYNKKRIILKNSFQSNQLIKKYFGNSLNFEECREEFFDNTIFAYSRSNEKDFIIEFLKKNYSRAVKEYIDISDRILNKEITLYEIKYNYGEKINWHNGFFYDFIWTLEPTENIDPRPKPKNMRNKDIYIDVKYTWALNSFQHFLYLGFGYFITNDKKYAIEFKNTILDWIRNNPPLYGINWWSGLEVSLRLINWIFIMHFFKDSKEINNITFFKRIFNSMFDHAFYLKFFYDRKKYNHTVGDLFGLYFFCKFFNKSKLIRKWEKKVFKKFKQQIFLQTRLDGVNIEQSSNYHRFVLEFFTLFLIINPNNLDIKEKNLIEKMYNYLIYLMKPDNSLPLIGDIDNGKLLLLTSYDNVSHKKLINIGSILFKRPDLKFLSKKLYPPTILLLGKQGIKVYNELEENQLSENFKYFEKSGYISIRNNWLDNANYIFIDFGRFGPANASHTHSSITNFIYSYKGKNIINDSGTNTYNKSLKDRLLFRSGKAHNILIINSKNQAKITGWYNWKDKPRIKSLILEKENRFEFFCLHDGYEGFLVSRKFIINKNIDEIIIKDTVIPIKKKFDNKKDNIDIFFHFDKNINLSLNSHSLIIDNELFMDVSSDYNFEMSIEKFFHSPSYGIKNECSMLRIHLDVIFQRNINIEFVSRIYPKNQSQL